MQRRRLNRDQSRPLTPEFRYFVYGLDIEAHLPLTVSSCMGQFRGEHHSPDVVIRAGTVAVPGNAKVEEGRYLSVGPVQTHLFWHDTGSLLIRLGREIVVDGASQAPESLLRFAVIGPGLGVVLHQRGYLVLHASAVVIAGGAVLFLADSGKGKSTLAAALHAYGHRLLADDVSAVDIGAAVPTVFPGFPHMKLSPMVAHQLGYEVNHSSDQVSDEKRLYPVSSTPEPSPLPIVGIFVLEEAGSNRIEPMTPQRAMIELIRNSYVARILPDSGTQAAHFRQCAQVARTVPVSWLYRRNSLADLPILVGLIESSIGRPTT